MLLEQKLSKATRYKFLIYDIYKNTIYSIYYITGRGTNCSRNSLKSTMIYSISVYVKSIRIKHINSPFSNWKEYLFYGIGQRKLDEKGFNPQHFLQ